MPSAEISTALIGIVALCFFLYRPMLDKPFSEDDGQWLYNALLKTRSPDTKHKQHQSHGYFGISWIFSRAFSAWSSPDSRAAYTIKAIWYTLTACSIFWLTLLIWPSALTAGIAATIFIVATALPSTLFFFTYGEHFFLLPINISLALVIIGTAGTSLPLILLAGIFSAWSNQIKITSLPITLATPLLFLLGGAFFPMLGLFWLGYLLVTAAPMLFIKDRYEKQTYFMALYGPVLLFLIMVLKKIKLPTVKKITKKASQAAKYDSPVTPYAKAMITKSRNRKLEILLENMSAPALDMSLPLLLCFAQIPLCLIQGGTALVPAGMLSLFIIMQQCQQNYHPPHFNPVWVPVAMLSAKTVSDLVSMGGATGAVISVCVVAASLWLGRVAFCLVRSRQAEQRIAIGDIEPRLSLLFKFAEQVGAAIRKATPQDASLFVWGDQPSLYLYANRRSIDPRYLFVYAHHGEAIHLPYLLKSLTLTPPDYIIFYNWRIHDDWDMEKIQAHTMTPYTSAGNFSVPGDDGKPYVDEYDFTWDFPLYQLDKAKYHETLLDRAQFLCKIKGPGYHIYPEVDRLFPGQPEPALKYDFWRYRQIRPQAMEDIEKRIAGAETAEETISLLHVRAMIAYASGDIDQELQTYETILKLNPMDIRAMAEAGGILLRKGDMSGATRHLARATALAPYSITAAANFALLTGKSGDMEQYTLLMNRCRTFLNNLDLVPTEIESFERMFSLESLQPTD
ncbi:tetratricopeptide repeat protein [Desulfovibrio sp. JC010]|uniref:tetratricopeptide repeat protein n=1 Tax=Desulfovibrio sp. JC010 TaxID=2593641 RepID=UPI0013D00C14|nr:ABC transporter permease [Desulfovibrio sp. JC010]NDV27508.1 hypothetical protein [Desulfovibrio sp. JC010]